MGGQRHAPAALTPGKTRYPLYMRLGGLPGRSRRVRKISPPPPGYDPRTFQPLASRYTEVVEILFKLSPQTKRLTHTDMFVCVFDRTVLREDKRQTIHCLCRRKSDKLLEFRLKVQRASQFCVSIKVLDYSSTPDLVSAFIRPHTTPDSSPLNFSHRGEERTNG